MNQIIEELKTDNEKLKGVITDLCDITGQMSLALLARLVRNQQDALDRQEIEIAGLKRQIKAMNAKIENNELGVKREAQKREVALNVIEGKHDALVARLKAKFEESNKP